MTTQFTNDNPMTLGHLYDHLKNRVHQHTQEYYRLFHGRGNTYGAYRFLTVDSIDEVLFAVLFEKNEDEEAIILMLRDFFDTEGKWESLVLQQRYLSSFSVIEGKLSNNIYAIENNLRYHVNFHNTQNIGFFPDMKHGREFIREHAHGKKVLNLFSYTCSFSVVAKEAGANKIVNVDMNKNVLSIGRENHRLNALDTKNVEFMPYNILKSWSRIRKSGPYDLIIIDPPSFQKGSFAATSDYEKIIRRLHEFTSDECLVLSALNAPELTCAFIQKLFQEHAPQFHFVERLVNMESFPDSDDERSLKNLIFKKTISSPQENG